MSEEKGLWAFVGKASVLVGLIVSAIAAKNEFWPNESAVVAKCQSAMFDAVGEDPILPLKTASGLKVALAEAGNDFTDKEINVISLGISDEIDRSIGYLVTRYSATGYGNCTISNFGGKNAENIEVSLDGSVYAVFLNGKRIHPVSEKIQLGTLKPGDKAGIGFFTFGNLSHFDEDDYSINYDNGVGEVLISEPVYGWKASLARSSDDGSAWILALLAFVLIMLFYNAVSNIINVIGAKKIEKSSSEEVGKKSD